MEKEINVAIESSTDSAQTASTLEIETEQAKTADSSKERVTPSPIATTEQEKKSVAKTKDTQPTTAKEVTIAAKKTSIGPAKEVQADEASQESKETPTKELSQVDSIIAAMNTDTPTDKTTGKIPTGKNQDREKEVAAATAETKLEENQKEAITKNINNNDKSTEKALIEIENIIATETYETDSRTEEEISSLDKEPTTTLDELVKDSTAEVNASDITYLKSLEDFFENQNIEKTALTVTTTEENNKPKLKPEEEETTKQANEPAKKKPSAVDAIIAAMNTEKASEEKKEEPVPQSYQQSIQSIVIELMKQRDE